MRQRVRGALHAAARSAHLDGGSAEEGSIRPALKQSCRWSWALESNSLGDRAEDFPAAAGTCKDPSHKEQAKCWALPAWLSQVFRVCPPRLTVVWSQPSSLEIRAP